MQFSDQFLQAIDHYFKGTATEAEKEMLNKWYHQHNDAMVTVDTNDADYEHLLETRLKNRIRESIGIEQPKQRRLWPRIISIAAAVIGIAICIYLYRPAVILNFFQDPAPALLASNDIAPGGYGAKITFASGKTVNLSSHKSGVVLKNNQLIYNDGTAVAQGSVDAKDIKSEAMTVSTRKGETYNFTWTDGTKVWLNSDSKLELLTKSGENAQRIAKLSGEVDFEVAKAMAPNGTRVPFVVESKDQRIEVLGTHFNVNAYNDEPSIRTTLLEGSVRLTSFRGKRSDEKSLNNATLKDLAALSSLKSSVLHRRDDGLGGEGNVTLKPGQQATNTGTMIKVETVNVNDAIAWKNNKFMFNGESITGIMKMIERWYNVEVFYTGPKPTETYSGGVSRFENVSKVLQILESSGGVRFKIEGRKIYVTKN